MCKAKTPDTSAQEAEALRQRQAEDARAEALRIADEQRYQQQRADDMARAEAQRVAQQAEADRQFQLLLGSLTQQGEAQRKFYADQKAEKDAEKAAAAQRAADSRAYVTGRQNLIDQSKAKIDEAYSGFNDTYFQKFAQDFVDTYRPQANRGYREATDKATFAYADSGNMRSSAAAKSFGDLARQKEVNAGKIANGALDASQTFQNDILGQKSDATSLLYSSGAVGADNLPDGVSDVNDMLRGIGSQLGSLTTTAANRAKNIKAPSFNVNSLDLSLNTRLPGRAA